EYVALSYVWGDKRPTRTDPSSYPQTIEDAITVSAAMGFHYFWVDQYCINQDNEAHKSTQMLMIGRVYSQASLCIVAAAGTDSSHVVPGVGKTARTPQLTFQLGDLDFFQRYSSGHTVARSKWRSRGWTFQEGCLSRRRLIFTDQEVLFLCRDMYCQESL
ncbi:heterokaryon incompatibility, partial [Ophiobolus disseminans]